MTTPKIIVPKLDLSKMENGGDDQYKTPPQSPQSPSCIQIYIPPSTPRKQSLYELRDEVYKSFAKKKLFKS